MCRYSSFDREENEKVFYSVNLYSSYSEPKDHMITHPAGLLDWLEVHRNKTELGYPVLQIYFVPVSLNIVNNSSKDKYMCSSDEAKLVVDGKYPFTLTKSSKKSSLGKTKKSSQLGRVSDSVCINSSGWHKRGMGFLSILWRMLSTVDLFPRGGKKTKKCTY